MSKRQSTFAQVGANAIFYSRGSTRAPVVENVVPPRQFANSTKPVDKTSIWYAIKSIEEKKFHKAVVGEIGILFFPNAISGEHFANINSLFGVRLPANAS